MRGPRHHPTTCRIPGGFDMPASPALPPRTPAGTRSADVPLTPTAPAGHTASDYLHRNVTFVSSQTDGDSPDVPDETATLHCDSVDWSVADVAADGSVTGNE